MTIDRNFEIEFSQRVDHSFWEGLAEGQVRVQRCSGCARWLWPAEWRCGKCGSWDLHWEAVAGEGRVYAWERTYQPFAPLFADMLPYVNIMVELPQAGGVRMLGLLLPPDDAVRIGARVIAAIQEPSERTQGLPALWWRLAVEGDAA